MTRDINHSSDLTVMATVVDLFCGAGGLSKGFEDAGFKAVFASDLWGDAIETYKANNPNVNAVVADIRDLKGADILTPLHLKVGGIDVVVGGPPCQGFSLAGRIGRKEMRDERNGLFLEFARVVNELRPKFIAMENVASLARHRDGKTSLGIKRHFEAMGYKTDYRILNAVNYGAPQYRRRVFFIGNGIGIENPFPKATHDGLNRRFRTVSDAIKDLPQLENGGVHKGVHNHEAMSHTPAMLQKMKYVQDGGDRSQIPRRLRPKKGDARKYIRYDSNAPSVCITGDMRKVFHYSQNRALTVRELARIQTFPDTYKFFGGRISQQQQVGNAVPPLLAKAVAKEIHKILTCGGYNGYNIAVQRVSSHKLHRE